MFIGILPTTLLQIFCENLFYFQVIFISMKIADDTFLGNCMFHLEMPFLPGYNRNYQNHATKYTYENKDNLDKTGGFVKESWLRSIIFIKYF